MPFAKKRAGSVSYKVEITDYAADFIEQNVALESVLRRFEWAVEMLSAFPFLGPAYDRSVFTVALSPECPEPYRSQYTRVLFCSLVVAIQQAQCAIQP